MAKTHASKSRWGRVRHSVDWRVASQGFAEPLAGVSQDYWGVNSMSAIRFGRLVLIAAGVAALCVALTSRAERAEAGGFAVREQSASQQGMSFAGAAAGGDLSSMYWNPAAVTVRDGLNSESHNAIILPSSKLTATGGTLLNSGDARSTEIAKEALVGASYYNFQLSPQVYLGMSVNAPFGLTTKPEDHNWDGAILARTSKIFNLVGTPTVGYKVSPGVAVAAGLQIGYMDAKFKFGPNSIVAIPGIGTLIDNTNNVGFRGDDYAFGFTLGALLTPMPGTRIGVGFRSKMTYDLEGRFFDNVCPQAAISPIPFIFPGSPGCTNGNFKASAEVTTPEIVTISITQALTQSARVMATFEWTNWSRFNKVDIVPGESGVFGFAALAGVLQGAPGGGLGATVAGQPWATLDANWDDGWMVAIGGELDMSPQLTVRAGVAFEESPIQRPEQRLTGVPDSDRLWVSAGATYRMNESMTFDVAYTHIFIDDATFDRRSIANANDNLIGEVEAKVDILSFGFHYKFGGPAPEPESLK